MSHKTSLSCSEKSTITPFEIRVTLVKYRYLFVMSSCAPHVFFFFGRLFRAIEKKRKLNQFSFFSETGLAPKTFTGFYEKKKCSSLREFSNSAREGSNGASAARETRRCHDRAARVCAINRVDARLSPRYGSLAVAAAERRARG